jgi:hypothetical protein
MNYLLHYILLRLLNQMAHFLLSIFIEFMWYRIWPVVINGLYAMSLV